MPDLYLELYKGPKVAEEFANLPGSQRYVAGADRYYAVVMPTPAAGSAQETYIASVPPSGGVAALTHGTDTLPAGTGSFIPTMIGIWWPKYPPYHFEVTTPAGDTVLVNPPVGGDIPPWYMVSVPQRDGIGVWLIRVIGTPASMPVSIGGRHAHLNPHALNFTAAEWFRQPLLRVVGPEVQPPACGELSRIRVTGCAPGTVTFHADIAAPGAVEEITWDFGDGSPETVGTADAAHTYAALPPGGEYIVTVTVLRPAGCTPRTQTATAVVVPCDTTCPSSMIDDIVIDVALSCNPDQTRDVRISPVLNSSASPVESYRWQFSDGSAPIDLDGSANPNITHRVLAAGTSPSQLTVTLVLVRAGGCSDTKSKTVQVDGCEAPCPSLNNVRIEETRCIAPQTRRVTLDGDVNGSPDQYVWDFGDGNSQTIEAGTPGSPRTTHDYSAPGTYQAKLTIIGPSSCRSEATVTVEVAACEPGVPGCMDPNALNYNPLATVSDGSCIYTPPRDHPPKPRLCRCKKWWCYLLGIGLSILTGLYILGVCNCFVTNTEELSAAILEAVANILLAFQILGAIGIGTAIIGFWRLCGACCTACFLLLGILLGIVAVAIQTYYQGQLPTCTWPAGVLATVGLILVAIMYATACDDE